MNHGTVRAIELALNSSMSSNIPNYMISFLCLLVSMCNILKQLWPELSHVMAWVFWITKLGYKKVTFIRVIFQTSAEFQHSSLVIFFHPESCFFSFTRNDYFQFIPVSQDSNTTLKHLTNHFIYQEYKRAVTSPSLILSFSLIKNFFLSQSDLSAFIPTVCCLFLFMGLCSHFLSDASAAFCISSLSQFCKGFTILAGFI